MSAICHVRPSFSELRTSDHWHSRHNNNYFRFQHNMCHRADTMRSIRDRRRKRSGCSSILRTPSALALLLALSTSGGAGRCSSRHHHCSPFAGVSVAFAFQPPLPPHAVVPWRGVSNARRVPSVAAHDVPSSGRVRPLTTAPAATNSQLHSRYYYHANNNNNWRKVTTTALSATNHLSRLRRSSAVARLPR